MAKATSPSEDGTSATRSPSNSCLPPTDRLVDPDPAWFTCRGAQPVSSMPREAACLVGGSRLPFWPSRRETPDFTIPQKTLGVLVKQRRWLDRDEQLDRDKPVP